MGHGRGTGTGGGLTHIGGGTGGHTGGGRTHIGGGTGGWTAGGWTRMGSGCGGWTGRGLTQIGWGRGRVIWPGRTTMGCCCWNLISPGRTTMLPVGRQDILKSESFDLIIRKLKEVELCHFVLVNTLIRELFLKFLLFSTFFNFIYYLQMCQFYALDFSLLFFFVFNAIWPNGPKGRPARTADCLFGTIS